MFRIWVHQSQFIIKNGSSFFGIMEQGRVCCHRAILSCQMSRYTGRSRGRRRRKEKINPTITNGCPSFGKELVANQFTSDLSKDMLRDLQMKLDCSYDNHHDVANPCTSDLSEDMLMDLRMKLDCSNNNDDHDVLSFLPVITALLRQGDIEDSLRYLRKMCKQSIKSSDVSGIFSQILQVCTYMRTKESEESLHPYVVQVLELLEKFPFFVPDKDLTERICRWFRECRHQQWTVARTVVDQTNIWCRYCNSKPEGLDKLKQQTTDYVKCLAHVQDQVKDGTKLFMDHFEYTEYREKMKAMVTQHQNGSTTPKTSTKVLLSQNAARDLCVFEYFEQNSCPFKRCLFSHVISDGQRNDVELQQKMLELKNKMQQPKERTVHGFDRKNRFEKEIRAHNGRPLTSPLEDSIPRNILDLENYLNKEGRFDVAIDLLNVCYHEGNFDPSRLASVVEYFLERHRRVLVIAGGFALGLKPLLTGKAGPGSDRHLTSKERDLHEVLLDITLNERCGLFFVSNYVDTSADDKHLLYTLAYYNFDIELVTKDMFRDHSHFLDESCQEAFRKWQQQKQHIFLGVDGERPVFKPRLDCSIRKHDYGWHIPVRENEFYCISMITK